MKYYTLLIYFEIVSNVVHANNKAFDFALLNKNYALFDSSECMLFLYGLSAKDTQVLALQDLLIWTKNKQMVILNSNYSDFSMKESGQKIIRADVDERHHPILLLSITTLGNGKTVISQSVICRNCQEAMNINFFTGSHWIFPFMSLSSKLERLCNNGKHMIYGKRLIVSVFSTEPFVFFDPNNRTKVSGVAIDLVNIVATKLNFDMTFLPSFDWSYMDFQTFELCGDVAEVMYGRADFAIERNYQREHESNAFAYYPLHFKNMLLSEYSLPLYRSDTIFIANIPGKQEPIYSFIRVFDNATWLIFFLSLVVTTFVYSIISKIVVGENLADTAWVPFGVTFQEFHDYKPENGTINATESYFRTDIIVLAIWTFGTFLLVSAYAGNLKSQFIVQDYWKRLENLELLDDGMPIYLPYSIYDNFMHLYGDQVGHLGLEIGMHAEKEGTIVPMSNDIGGVLINKTISGRGSAVFNHELISLYKLNYMRQGQDFPFYVIPERFKMQHMGYAFPKYSPMVHLFDDVIVWLKDSGIIEQLFERRVIFRSMKNQISNTSANDKVILAHILIPILLLLMGLTISTLCLAYEMIEWRKVLGLIKSQLQLLW